MADFDSHYELGHRYTQSDGRVYLTGVQALVRLPLAQARRDQAAGLRTAGFISGYRGSPLGTYDTALWQARELLESHRIHFEPGVNEDLAATAVWGSQQANLLPGPRYDGVFGIWYGKGPGVDRSCDALKHANYAGTAPKGGVLALCGDDPAARSSSIAHQSEQALVHCGIPVLNPSNVQDLLDLGLQGIGLSRYAGCWVGLKCVTDVVDSAASVVVGGERASILAPENFALPETGLHIAWGNLPLAVETRVHQQRLPAAQAFARANGIDRVALDAPRRRFGIVTTGKAYLDVRQALEDLGLDEERARELGLCIYKVGLSWPLEPEGAREFARGLEHLLVVEEKRAFVEDQLARLLYNESERPRLCGKHEEDGSGLVPAEGELSPSTVATSIRRWLDTRAPEFARIAKPVAAPVLPLPGAGGLMRLPAFCSGCPHNTSTLLPDESLALGGIGCHGMAVWLPERRTLAVTQMGGEGANWIGQAPFTDTGHIFQNLGDGTYFHSGLLAIRAAVTAGVNITYKILANGAVAMTGGQPIEGESIDGEVTVPEIVRQLRAEGVARIAVVSDQPEKFGESGGGFGRGVSLHHRDALDRIQRELREVPGVSALVYDQTCAAEARRLRKRGSFPDPDRRIVINELVCEGCGDCSVQSNCISIQPVETELGRKRRIDQSSCNKDESCLKGYCPSFVTVHGPRLRRADSHDDGDDTRFAALPDPEVAACETPFNLLVTGIGGSGVVTVGAIVAVAAHLEGKGCSELDVTGLAQKNGPVASHVRVAARPEDLFATRVSDGAADLLIASDLVVASAADSLSKLSKERTTLVADRFVAPTSDFASNPDLDLSSARMESALRQCVGDAGAHFLAASELARALTGDAIAKNLFLLGYAAQLGRLPVGLPALERAIVLNGRAVEMNTRALRWGRLAAHDLDAVESAARPGLHALRSAPIATTLEERVERRVALLCDYQNAAYGRRYAQRVQAVVSRERELGFADHSLADRVASAYFKLLAYKDEYEVARLWSDGSFRQQLATEFEEWSRIELHLAPQILNRRDPDTGRAAKWVMGPWIFPALGLLARFRFLRGSALDPFGRTAHRRRERALITEYEATLERLLAGLTRENRELAIEIAALPEQVRGFDLVKDANLEEAKRRESELLARFNSED